MNIEHASTVCAARAAPKREVVQATLVLLAHARAKLDRGDKHGAKELSFLAERGLQALPRSVLVPLLRGGRWAFIARGHEDVDEVANQVLARVWESFMRKPNPMTPAEAENMHPFQAMSWLNTLARNLAIDRNQHYGSRTTASRSVPVAEALPHQTMRALSAELQNHRESILVRAVQLLEAYSAEHPTRLAGRISTRDLILILLDFKKGEHGLTDAVIAHIGKENAPTRSNVRKALEDLRQALADRLGGLPEEFQEWTRRAHAEASAIGDDAAESGDSIDPAFDSTDEIAREAGSGDPETPSEDAA